MLITLFLLALVVTAPQDAAQKPAPSAPAADELLDAVRDDDVARVRAALDKGADVNAKTRYGTTALTFAAGRGNLEIIKLLVERGADVNAQDTFYRMRAIDMAMMNKHTPVARFLLERGSKGAPSVLMAAIQAKDLDLVKLTLASPDLTAGNLNNALVLAKKLGEAAIVEAITAKSASMPSDGSAKPVVVDRATLQSYVGAYRNESGATTVTVSLTGDQLTLAAPGQTAVTLVPTSPTTFRAAEFEGLAFAFAGRGGTIERMTLTQPNGTSQGFERVAANAAAAPATPAPAENKPAADAGADKPAPRGPARPWPAFRGLNAEGNGDGQGAVTDWDLATKRNVRWATPIPGISNASPIVWGDRVFVVTAISSAKDSTFRTGLYGDVNPVDDLSEHTWKIYGLDRNTGKVLWEQTAFTGKPRVKRHTKASQANSTPVTDGKRVVAVFGSIGLLAAWDVDGKPLWTRDIGVLDSGWFFDPDYQWGHSSSPIIVGGNVILQADQQKGSYLAAYDLATGKEVWRTDRDEISTWGTPTVFRDGGREQIVTNGTKIRGYDAATGKLLWTMGPNSEITVGTPVTGEGLVYVTGGYPPVRPLYAIKPTASGEIVVPKDTVPEEAMAWKNEEGTYIPTPLYYRGILYTFRENGILSGYDAKTGERLFRSRVGSGGSFAASPVAADGRLYFASEDGDVYVARAGRTYEELAKNSLNEVIMSTPAISDGLIVIRTIGHVYGIGADK
jgi:outer membrane protein assembly factor BamB